MLVQCAAVCTLKGVRWLVQAEADVNQRTASGGLTPLMMCGNAPPVARYLLRRGTDVHARTARGDTIAVG